MNLFDELKEIYSELTSDDFHPQNGTIALVDDGDGVQYIATWNYTKPLPKGFSIGKNA